MNFIIYPFLNDHFFTLSDKKNLPHLYHSLSRLIGFDFVKKDIDWVLFLDVDEIADGINFKKWLDAKKNCAGNYFSKTDAMRLANYWYFLSSRYRAKVLEDSAVFVKKKKLSYKSLLDIGERDAIFSSIKKNKKRCVLGVNNLPLVHHYSWVRTKATMLKKVKSWGHKNDRDWEKEIEKQFSSSDLEKDFVHSYEIEKVAPFVDIDLEKKQTLSNACHKNIAILKQEQVVEIMKKCSKKGFVCFAFKSFFSKIVFKLKPSFLNKYKKFFNGKILDKSK